MRPLFISDGNGGPDAAEYASKHMLSIITAEFGQCNGDLGGALSRSIAALDNAFARLGKNDDALVRSSLTCILKEISARARQPPLRW